MVTAGAVNAELLAVAAVHAHRGSRRMDCSRLSQELSRGETSVGACGTGGHRCRSSIADHWRRFDRRHPVLPSRHPHLLTFALGIGAVGSGFYFSTRDGRTRIQHVAEPTYQTFLMTKTGQRIIYDVGPRPSPQALAEAVLPTDMISKLVVSLLVDLIGSASYLIPIAGEGFDLTWAPVSMVLVGAMYDGVMPNLKYVALMEELLPFTNWIPSATMGWVKEFGPGIIDEGKRKMGDAKRVGRREREALVNMAR